MLIFSAKATNKTLKALALLAGTLTHGLRHFVPNFSPCVIALYAGVGMTPFVNPERALP